MKSRLIAAVATVSLAAAGLLVGVGLAAQGTGTSAAAQYGKLVICHHTHSKKHPQQTISVAASAWKAHQRHGDTVGACTTPSTTTTTTTAKTTTTASTASPGKSGQPHGNSGGHGKGNGHG